MRQSVDQPRAVAASPDAFSRRVLTWGRFGPDGGRTLATSRVKIATIRGVESRGIMCSVRELQLGEDHEGIIELPADAPVGATYAEWAKLYDVVFDVAITPNRQDCMGVRGIARDLAAAGVGTLKPLKVPLSPPALARVPG